jgi:hypothetical protein
MYNHDPLQSLCFLCQSENKDGLQDLTDKLMKHKLYVLDDPYICCVFCFVCLILCAQCRQLSLDCSFLIAPSRLFMNIAKLRLLPQLDTELT